MEEEGSPIKGSRGKKRYKMGNKRRGRRQERVHQKYSKLLFLEGVSSSFLLNFLGLAEKLGSHLSPLPLPITARKGMGIILAGGKREEGMKNEAIILPAGRRLVHSIFPPRPFSHCLFSFSRFWCKFTLCCLVFRGDLVFPTWGKISTFLVLSRFSHL